MPDDARSRGLPDWVIPAIWIVLAFLLLSLIALAVFLFFKMDFLSGTDLTDEQTKTLWTFLGVALGAVVTLIGALLTEQHNRRTDALTHEAQQREALAKEAQAKLNEQAEQRLRLDTVGNLLELLTDGGNYAKPARVGGAIATMVELKGGAVALRVLGDLWATNAVGTTTAVWLIEGVLNGGRPEEEQVEAATLLAMNAGKLIPARDDPEQEWYGWPSLPRPWPAELPEKVKDALILMSLRVMLAREREYWEERNASVFHIHMWIDALNDENFRGAASLILVTLLDLGVLEDFVQTDDQWIAQVREWADSYDTTNWFTRLLDQFEPWAKGEPVQVSQAGPPAALTKSSPTP